MPLHVLIYRNPLGDCTLNGPSKTARGFCIMNVDGPHSPSPDYPAAFIVDDFPMGQRYPKIVPESQLSAKMWSMAGGNFAGSCDSRWRSAVEKAGGGPHGMLPIHDRVER